MMIVVTIPAAVFIATMIVRMSSFDLLYMVQELHLGLQYPPSFAKKCSEQSKVVLLLISCSCMILYGKDIHPISECMCSNLRGSIHLLTNYY